MSTRDEKLLLLRTDLCDSMGEVNKPICFGLKCKDCVLNTVKSLNKELTQLCHDEIISLSEWKLDDYDV